VADPAHPGQPFGIGGTRSQSKTRQLTLCTPSLARLVAPSAYKVGDQQRRLSAKTSNLPSSSASSSRLTVCGCTVGRRVGGALDAQQRLVHHPLAQPAIRASDERPAREVRNIGPAPRQSSARLLPTTLQRERFGR
jgi:hypothetical protein